MGVQEKENENQYKQRPGGKERHLRNGLRSTDKRFHRSQVQWPRGHASQLKLRPGAQVRRRMAVTNSLGHGPGSKSVPASAPAYPPATRPDVRGWKARSSPRSGAQDFSNQRIIRPSISCTANSVADNSGCKGARSIARCNTYKTSSRAPLCCAVATRKNNAPPAHRRHSTPSAVDPPSFPAGRPHSPAMRDLRLIKRWSMFQ